jgi:hypothetical protein
MFLSAPPYIGSDSFVLLEQQDASVRGNRAAHRFMPLAIVMALDEHSRAQHGELTEQGAVIVGIDCVVIRIEPPEHCGAR